MNKLIAVLVLSSALLAAAADTASMSATSASAPAVSAPIVSTPAVANSNAVRKITMNASLRSKCLTAVANLLTENLKACKDRISNPKFSNCKQSAYNIAKFERAACPTSKSSLK
jgi:hypothetical protein